MLNARDQAAAQEIIASARARDEAREVEYNAALIRVENWISEHLSQELVSAAHIALAVDAERLREDEPDRRLLAGYATLNVRDGEQWRIVQRFYHGREWRIAGPEGYVVTLASDWQEEILDDAILDAIITYPSWLAHETELRAEMERQAYEEARTRLRETPAMCVAVKSLANADDPVPSVLAVGHRVILRKIDNTQYTGIIQDLDARWILLNVEGASGVGAQRLIALARVEEIIPLMTLRDGMPLPQPISHPDETFYGDDDGDGDDDGVA